MASYSIAIAAIQHNVDVPTDTGQLFGLGNMEGSSEKFMSSKFPLIIHMKHI